MIEPKEYTQGELAKELGLTSNEVREARDKHLSSDQWSKRGRAVVYSPDGARKLAAALLVRDEIPEAVPLFVQARSLGKVCANPRYHQCVVNDGDMLVKVAVLVPNSLRKNPRLLPKGKLVRVQCVEVDGTKYYRHEDLCR